MIIQGNSQIPAGSGPDSAPQPILRWAKNDRTAGSIPVWGAPVSPRQQTEQDLSYALNGPQAAPENSNSYRPQERPAPSDEAFGFGDLIDMINPLQQIPIVGHIYRELTGDKIRSSSQIIGGAIYGGFIGAGAGIVNAIAEKETGDDITGNALGVVSGHGGFSKQAEYKYTIAAYNAARPRYNE